MGNDGGSGPPALRLVQSMCYDMIVTRHSIQISEKNLDLEITPGSPIVDSASYWEMIFDSIDFDLDKIVCIQFRRPDGTTESLSFYGGGFTYKDKLLFVRLGPIAESVVREDVIQSPVGSEILVWLAD